MNDNHSKLLRGCAFAALLAGPVAPVLAQEPAVEGEELERLGTVTVTAQKREESARDVPISISVFDEDIFLETGVEALDDLSLYTPNLVASWDFNPQFTTIAIRGLTSNTSNGGIDPSVGVFLDGVYLARPEMYSTELADITRVEVLRGPQGALYGKNTTVGAINIHTRDPGDELAGRIDATLGDYEQRRVRGWVTAPLGEDVSALLSGFIHQRDGFTENTVNGDTLGNTDSAGARAKLRFEPTPNFDVTGTLEYYQDDSGGTIGDWFILSPLVGLLGGDTNPRDFRSAISDNERVERDTWGATIDANLALANNITLTSITAYRGLDFDLNFDFDTTPAAFAESGKVEEQGQFTQELRVASDYAGPWNFVAGLFYLSSELDQTTTTLLGPDLVGFELPRARPFEQDTTSYAAFGQLRFEPTDRLTLSAGLRYTNEEKEVVTSQSGLDIPTLAEESLSRSEDDLSPSLSVTYEVSDQVNLFASFAQGFKSGGFNAATIDPPATDFSETEFEEETATSYEAGVKTLTADGRLAFNMTAFFTRVDDLQVSDFDGERVVVRNAAEAESYGIEADLTWLALDNLELAGAFGWNPTEYVSYPDAPGNPPIPPNPATRDLSGEPLSRAPEFNASLRARYDFEVPFGANDAFLSADYTYLSDHFLGAEIDPVSEQDAYGLLNARAGIDLTSSLEFSIWGRNLTDEYYFTAVAAPFGDVGRIGWPAAPLTWGADLAWTF